MSGDSLGDRMKRYEESFRPVLPRRMPLIIRVDGKAFHSWTRGLERPFCALLSDAMDEAAFQLCGQIQGAQFAYVQSDEISVLVHSYKTLESQPWFGNEQQKIVSVSASIAATTLTMMSPFLFDRMKPALFDARAFVVPENDVCNYFIWRQQDATRNSVQMLAQSLYSHKQLHGKNTSELQEMCFQKGHNWNDLPSGYRRGRAVWRKYGDGFIIDRTIPIFTQDRAFIESHLIKDSAA